MRRVSAFLLVAYLLAVLAPPAYGNGYDRGNNLSLSSEVTGILPGANGGTGVDNGTKTLTLGGNFVTSGANNVTLATTGPTSVTLPTSGTLQTAQTTAAGYGITNGAAIDALGAVSSNGLLTRTGIGTYSARTLTGTSNQVSVANGDGVSGNPTLSLPQDIHTGATPTFAGGHFTGNVSIGGTSFTPLSELEVASTSTSVPRGIISSQFSTSTDSGRLSSYKARGTKASPTTVASGDFLGRWSSFGYDGSNYIESGSFVCAAEGTVASTRVPSYCSIFTSTDAAPSVLTERFKVDGSGHVFFNGAAQNSQGIMYSASDIAAVRLDITNSNSGSSARVGLIARADTASLSLDVFTSNNSQSILGTTAVSQVKITANSSNAFNILTASNVPLALGTNNVNRLHILGTGNIGVATLTPVTEFHVASTATSSPRGIMSSQHSTGTDGARLHLRKSRGTNTSPTTIVTGDTLSKTITEGYDGSNYLEMGSVDFVAEGTIAATRVPTRFVVSTATDAAPSVLTERMRIDSAGLMTLAGSQTITGTIKSTATSDIGWSVVAGANTACNTTCTNACVMGFDAGATSIVACTDATADKCLCAGAS